MTACSVDIHFFFMPAIQSPAQLLFISIQDRRVNVVSAEDLKLILPGKSQGMIATSLTVSRSGNQKAMTRIQSIVVWRSICLGHVLPLF
jgi:hypothetical protein